MTMSNTWRTFFTLCCRSSSLLTWSTGMTGDAVLRAKQQHYKFSHLMITVANNRAIKYNNSDTKVSYQITSNQLSQMQTKQIRLHYEWSHDLGWHNNHHGPKTEKKRPTHGINQSMNKIAEKCFLHLPAGWDDRSETWFKTFCILIRCQT